METTLIDVTRRHARTQPDKTALVFEGRTTTYGELELRSNRVANALLADGVRKGDHVGYLGKNTDGYFETWFGAMKIGAMMTPISWRLAVPEIRYMLEDADVRVLFAGRECVGAARELATAK